MHNFTIRIEDSNKQETISKITSIIQKHEPNYKSSYVYLSDYLNTQYGAEEKTFRLILSASALALLLSMIGLYALSAYSLACRTKELGVRKILGASLPTLLRLLLTDSTKWVLVANIIALPIGWYLAKDWLNDFAYRIDISPWIFISAIVSTYLIAMLTIAWQVLQAARTNPVNALRYE
jgi:putative ABC transport system permease protein